MCGVRAKQTLDFPPVLSLHLSDALRCHLPPYFWADGSFLPGITPWRWAQSHQLGLRLVLCGDGHAPGGPVLLVEDTCQGFSLFPLTAAEVQVPNLGSSDAWSERKESSRGNSPPAGGPALRQLRARRPVPSSMLCCGAWHPPSLHPPEPSPCERSPWLSSVGLSLPSAPNLLIENNPHWNSLG